MNDSHRGKLVAVAFALLLPLTIEQAVRVIGKNATVPTQFYSVVVAGAAAIIIGMKVAGPTLCSGFFFGGILTIARNYYLHWGMLNDMTRLITLLLALGAIILLTCLKNRKPAKRAAPARKTSRKK